MPNPYFQFKQFIVYHDRCAMKVGTDGVLLGAWTDCRNNKRILDIGTGSGLIALMLAQRSKASIDAIEIDTEACEQAQQNFERSPFSGQIQSHPISLQEFQPEYSYDLIVSNPPFFVASLKSPDKNRNAARHTDTLNSTDLFIHVRRLLSSEGRFCLVIPVDQLETALQAASANQFHLTQKALVYPTPESKPKRALLEFSSLQSPCIENEITIEISRHQYSEEFKKLTKTYYL